MARTQTGAAWSFRPLMVRETAGAVQVRTPEAVSAQCEDLRESAQEAFVCFDMNAKRNVIDRRLVTLGLANESLIHPREVFRGAIQAGACAVVLAHNHPSGDPTPSAEDIRVTCQLVEVGRIIDIQVMDHVIIGRATPAGDPNPRPAYHSMRESGVVSFN